MYFKPHDTEDSEGNDNGSDDDESEDESLSAEGALGFYSNGEDESDQAGDDDDESVPAGFVSVDL